MGKDSTFTGRTYLWSQGIKDGLQRPFTGWGYQAFWVVGQPLAERYWYEYGMFDRAGFHFHNLFINVFVELGFVGLILMIMIYLSTGVKSVQFLLRNGANLQSVFFVGITIMFILRALPEVDTSGPFGIGPLLFFSIIPRITEYNKITQAPQTAPPPKAGKIYGR
jgi:exopolysaccharide production protein ExoQ